MNKDHQALVADIFRACRELSAATGRPISPDGHLVGGLGEVIASKALNLDLFQPSNKGFDAKDPAEKKVEIKATTRDRIYLSDANANADRLVVVKFDADGLGEIVYDGPVSAPLEASRRSANGQRSLSLSKLRALSDSSS